MIRFLDLTVHRFGRWLRTESIAVMIALLAMGIGVTTAAAAGPLRAGVAKADITDRDAGPVHDPLYAKALVSKDSDTTVVLLTVEYRSRKSMIRWT